MNGFLQDVETYSDFQGVYGAYVSIIPTDKDGKVLQDLVTTRSLSVTRLEVTPQFAEECRNLPMYALITIPADSRSDE